MKPAVVKYFLDKRPDVSYTGAIVNDGGTRKLKDFGKSPKLDAELFSGRAKAFATDMSVDYDPNNDIIIVSEHTLTYENKQRVCHPYYNLWTDLARVEWYDATATYNFYTIHVSYSKIHFVFKPTEFLVYLDGFLASVVPTDGYLMSRESNIGVRGAAYVDGNISNVQFWTKALTAEDILLDYNEPEALVNMVANDVVDARFSVVKSDCQLMLPMTEDDDTLYDLATSNSYLINNYATLPNTNIRALSTGLQTSKFKLDGAGTINGVGEGIEVHDGTTIPIPTTPVTNYTTISSVKSFKVKDNVLTTELN